VTDPLRDRQQDPYEFTCDQCGEEFYGRPWASPYVGGYYCEECAREIAWDEMKFYEEDLSDEEI
jgi:NMD protein affecting ribosome stability and mRNA decay